MLGRLQDAIRGQRRRGGTVTRQTRGVVISEKGRGSPDSRSGFFGRMALKLMQNESRNGEVMQSQAGAYFPSCDSPGFCGRTWEVCDRMSDEFTEDVSSRCVHITPVPVEKT